MLEDREDGFGTDRPAACTIPAPMWSSGGVSAPPSCWN